MTEGINLFKNPIVLAVGLLVAKSALSFAMVASNIELLINSVNIAIIPVAIMFGGLYAYSFKENMPQNIRLQTVGVYFALQVVLGAYLLGIGIELAMLAGFSLLYAVGVFFLLGRNFAVIGQSKK